MTENGVKEIATYEHPGSYVVVPVPVRDRIMARLTNAEAERAAWERQAIGMELKRDEERAGKEKAERERDEAKPVLEAARKQAHIGRFIEDHGIERVNEDGLTLRALDDACRHTEATIRTFDAAHVAVREQKC